MKIALAQINPTIGHLVSNVEKMLDFCARGKKMGADLIVFPELSLPGYPPKDLLLRKDFVQAQFLAIKNFCDQSPLPAIIGVAIQDNSELFNSAVFCDNGKFSVVAKKLLLPNYNVFDEKRYFHSPASSSCERLFFNDYTMLISICEDAWSNDAGQSYNFDPIENAIRNADVDVIINLSASPFTMTKQAIREKIFTTIANKYKKVTLTVCQVGANDQLLFDGRSLVINQQGQIIDRGELCKEDLLIVDVASPKKTSFAQKNLDANNVLIEMLSMGIKDYVEKCQMPGVIVGVSGGIDSAVCLTLAVYALGSSRVRAVFLPSQFTIKQSYDDAHELTHRLSLKLETIPIEDSVLSLRHLLKDESKSAELSRADILDQNIQARLRGLIIMALSNATNYLMIATSNKSELAVGYSTTYGDMCGAFSAIGDLYKTQVWDLARALNKQGNFIPEAIIDRAPTAELKPDQLDCDSLPHYHVLDQILFNFIDLEKNIDEIHHITGFDPKLISKVIRLVFISEYKRRQAPFCLMVSDKAFGEARRYPIAMHLSGL